MIEKLNIDLNFNLIIESQIKREMRKQTGSKDNIKILLKAIVIHLAMNTNE